MTLALVGQVLVLSIVLGTSGLAIFYACFVQLHPKHAPRSVRWFQQFGFILFWTYVCITALVTIGLGVGFGLVIARALLREGLVK